MKVTAKRIDRDLTLQLHGELDHHGAKEVMLEIDRHLDVALPLRTTLDFSGVVLKREYGRDQHLNSLRYFNVQYPFAGKIEDAPVYKNAGRLTANKKEYEEKTHGIRMGDL